MTRAVVFAYHNVGVRCLRVLLAHGSWFAGYAFYVKARRLHYVHNYLGLAEYRIAASEDLPAGRRD